MNLSRAFSSPLACFRLTRCRPPSPAAGREGTPGAASPRHPDEASPLISAQKGPFIEAATASFPSAVTEEFIVHVYFKASAGGARERPFASAPRRDGPRWPGAMANLPRTALPGIGRCRVLPPPPPGAPLDSSGRLLHFLEALFSHVCCHYVLPLPSRFPDRP